MYKEARDFPGRPVVKTPHFQCRGLSIPGQGTKMPHALQRGQKKQKQKNKEARCQSTLTLRALLWFVLQAVPVGQDPLHNWHPVHLRPAVLRPCRNHHSLRHLPGVKALGAASGLVHPLRHGQPDM